GAGGDEATQGGAAGVLPRQPKEVPAGDLSDAAPVGHRPIAGHAGNVDPGVVGAVACRPDDIAGVQAAAVGETDDAPVCASHRWPEPDSRRLQPAAAASDAQVGPTPPLA